MREFCFLFPVNPLSTCLSSYQRENDSLQTNKADIKSLELPERDVGLFYN